MLCPSLCVMLSLVLCDRGCARGWWSHWGAWTDRTGAALPSLRVWVAGAATMSAGAVGEQGIRLVTVTRSRR